MRGERKKRKERKKDGGMTVKWKGIRRKRIKRKERIRKKRERHDKVG